VMVRTVGTLPTHILAVLVHAGIAELIERDALVDAITASDYSNEQAAEALSITSRLLGITHRTAKAIADHQGDPT